MSQQNGIQTRWYAGITRYQWVVLAIACLGWIFDVFEGQLFAVFKTPALADLLDVDKKDVVVDWFGNVGLASFLIGGTVGGLLFGVLADRIGRRKTMIWSILTYSVFSGLHYFATDPWQIIALRFFVAMGVAGEWAIAASLVAEVFPQKARTMAGGIFHASSVIGATMGSGLGMVLTGGQDWRWAFLIGVLPALLVVWVLASIKESEKWQAATSDGPRQAKRKGGSLVELFSVAQWRNRALIGLGLASVGLGTYWAIYAWVPELAREVLGDDVSEQVAQSRGSFVYLIMNITGGFAGLLAFAPIAILTNRRTAFALYHVGALVLTPITFLCAATYTQTLVLAPIMGFFVVGMHAGYAIYFPELFPTRLRATGASFCFNVGRLVSAVMLLARGYLREHMGLRWAVSVMASLFLIGLVLLWFAPETKDKELPE
ncbi:MAG: MFS transporter [Planctomycetota bacterium]|jgi:MFS family permease